MCICWVEILSISMILIMITKTWTAGLIASMQKSQRGLLVSKDNKSLQSVLCFGSHIKQLGGECGCNSQAYW
ncbi:hypothetical protein GE21DRAFT_1052883 [Neurospora crassa]|nr:hypothetical protein GE21DRAFT_1052883 [Neurospora crassa]